MSVSVSRLAALLAVVAVVALAGCGTLLDPGPSLPEGEDAVETFRSLDSYNATYVYEVTDDNGTETFTGQRTVRPSTTQIYDRIERSDGETILHVNNGSATWLYNVTANNVTRYDTSRGQFGGQQLEQLVNNARADDTADSDPILPVGPFIPIADKPSDDFVTVGPKEISYEGTETVAGREAHVIEVTASAEGTESFFQRYYLDTEWFVQLKFAQRTEINGTRSEVEMRFTDVEFGPDLPSGIFEFTPPADASVEQPPVQVTTYDSREALDSASSFSLPEVDQPDGFQFERGQQLVTNTSEFATDTGTTDGTVAVATLVYTNGRSSLFVEKQNATLGTNETDGEAVDIAGQTGQYRQIAGQAFVAWRCDGYSYSVGGALTRDTLIETAESVVCD